MNIQDLGSLGEFVAAIATVLTLAYLAIQIRQNSKLLQLNNTYQTLDASRTNFLACLAQIDVPALAAKALNGDEFTDTESEAYSMYFISQIRNFENAFLQHRGGGLDDEILEAIKTKVFTALSTKAGKDAWIRTRPQAVKSFRDWVGGIIDEDTLTWSWSRSFQSVRRPDCFGYLAIGHF